MVLDNKLTSVKKKKKPDAERKVKAYLTTKLKKLAETLREEVLIDWPPASEYGTAGRPDCYCFIGDYFMMIEVKTETGRLSPIQQRWHTNYHRHHSGVAPLFTIYGKPDVDKCINLILAFYELKQEFESRADKHIKDFNQQWSALLLKGDL